MGDKICSSCGKELPSAAVFCSQCGGRDLLDVSVPSSDPGYTVPVITPDSPTIPVESAAGFPAPPSDPTLLTDPTDVWSTPSANDPMGFAPPPSYPPPMAASPAPAPVPPVTAAPAVTTPASGGGGKFGAALVLLGGAAAIVGAFLDWMKVTPEWADAFTLSGWTLTDDAKIAVGLGAAAVIAAIVVLGGGLRGPMRVVGAILGIVLIGLGAYDTYDIVQRLPGALEDAGVGGIEIAAPAIGLILVIAGGVVVLLGAVAMSGGKSRASSAPMAGVGGTSDPFGAPAYPQVEATPVSGGFPPQGGGFAPPTGGFGGSTGGIPGSGTGAPPPPQYG